jgi:hypothetical protein
MLLNKYELKTDKRTASIHKGKFLSYYINNIVTKSHVPSVKQAAGFMSCYHINITLTQSRVASVNPQLQSCQVII